MTEQIYELEGLKLSKRLQGRRCHTFRDVIMGKSVDDGAKKVDSLEKLLESPLIKSIMADPVFQQKLEESYGHDHTAAQDTTAAINELASAVVDAAAPNSIGRDLVRVYETMKESIKVRLPARGFAKKTGRGKKTVTQGLRSSFVELTPNKYFEASESWDQTYVEDADWDILREQTEEVARACSEIETTEINTQLDAITGTDLAAGALTSATSSGLLKWDDLCNMWGSIQSADFSPDKMAANPIQLADLFKEEEFTNSLMMGSAVDLTRGTFGQTILGTMVLGSSKITDTHTHMIDSTKVILEAIRRDGMIRTWEDGKSNEFGVGCSTRYALGYGRKSAAQRGEDF